jgi:hypothetical protein
MYTFHETINKNVLLAMLGTMFLFRSDITNIEEVKISTIWI